jgi:hypothetical protein
MRNVVHLLTAADFIRFRLAVALDVQFAPARSAQ